MKEEARRQSFLNAPTIVILAIMITISISFFSLLEFKTSVLYSPGENPNNLSIPAILFAIVIAILATSFLIWLKNFMEKSPYLGLIMGIVSLGLFIYAVTQKYIGPYTYGFTGLISLVVLIYLGIYFYKYHSATYKKTDEELNND